MEDNHRYMRRLPESGDHTADERSRRKRLFAWIAAGGLLVVALCAVGIALLYEPEKRPVNLGVAAAWQYITEYRTDREALAGAVQKNLGKRLLEEPLEIEADVTVSADDLSALGLPVNRLILGLDAKYDLKDLGVKLRVLGLEYARAYLIGDEVVLSMLGDTVSAPLGLPVEEDLEQSMGLEERALGFAPLLTGDEAFYEQLVEAAAQSVPDEYTSIGTASVYSPLDGAETEMTVIETALDEAALQTVAQNMDAQLQENEDWRRQADDMLQKSARYYGLDADSLNGWLQRIADGSALADDYELRWRVYERQGRYVGLAVQVTQSGQVTEWRMMTELSGSESHEALSLSVNGAVLQSAEYTVVYDGSRMEVSGAYHPDASQVFNIDADLSFEEKGDAYRVTGTVTIDGPLLGGEAQPVSFDIDADIRAGEGLGTLKETSGWQNVYSEEWKSSQDGWQGLVWPQG